MRKRRRKLTQEKADAINRKRDMVELPDPNGTRFDVPQKPRVEPTMKGTEKP